MTNIQTTPNLANEFHPVPRPAPKAKKQPAPIGPGKKTTNWQDGRELLKKQFAAWGIVACEIRFEGCLRDNFLGFAHTERRVNLTPEDVRSPNKVVLACQQCHTTCDFEMPKKESRELLERIIKNRT